MTLPADCRPAEFSVAGQIDQLCDHFEAAWLAGRHPVIEDYLATWAEPARTELLCELLRVELEHRRETGERPTEQEYLRRFGGHAELVDRLFTAASTEKAPRSSRSRRSARHFEPTNPVIPGYEVVDTLGRGGMGVVYLARQVRLKRLVALKMILAGSHAGEQERHRFQREAEVIARLQHPHIVQVFEVDEHDSQPYFAMEYCPGGSLADRLGGTPMPPRDAAALVRTLAWAVQAAHDAGVVHRDLKPANVLLSAACGLAGAPEEGTAKPQAARQVPKIADFGLAKQADAANRSASTALVGTPSYMAPEQAAGKNGEVGPAVDVYALGAILYECLTGRPPFRAATIMDTLAQVANDEPVPPRQLLPQVPRDVQTICLKCLRKEVGERYPTASALAEDLERFLNDQPVKARPVRWHERAARWCRRNPVLAGLGALLALTFLAGNALVTWKWREAEQAHQAERKSRQEADERAAEIREGLERMKAANALVERSWSYANLGHWDNAEADLTRAVRLRPEDPRVWMERGLLYTRLGLWGLVGPDVARSFALHEPAVPWNYHLHAMLRLHAGDAPGYRGLCARMRKRFAGTKYSDIAIILVRTCALAPDPDGDPTWLVEMGQSLVCVEPGDPVKAYVLGVAHYRAGQYEQAVQSCDRSLALSSSIWQMQALNGPILAMARHRLDQGRAARAALDEAGRARDRGLRERYQGKAGFWSMTRWDWLESQLHYREAREQLGLPPPADDPRVHFLRGRALSRLQRHAEAAAEFDAALKLGPHDPAIRSEAHRNQAHYHIRRQEWEKVTAEFARAVAAAPEQVDLWHSLALAHQAAGNGEGYRQVCVKMRRHFANTKVPEAAGRLVLTCTLTPAAATDPAELVALVRVAAPWQLGSIRCLAAALYRAGRYEEAVNCFGAAARVARPVAQDWLILAMAHSRLGNHEEARRCLARADDWVVQADRPEANDISGTRPTWGRWFDRTEIDILRREAVTLLGNVQ